MSSRSRQTSGRGLWWLAEQSLAAAAAAAGTDCPCCCRHVLHPSTYIGRENTILTHSTRSSNCKGHLSTFFPFALVLGLLHFAPAAAAFVIAATPENGRKFATDELVRLFVGHDAIEWRRRRRRRRRRVGVVLTD